jgi:hypothetical protein
MQATSSTATPPSVKVQSRRPTVHTWSSPAHHFVTVEYLWRGESDPVGIVKIEVRGDVMNESTRKFFARFNVNLADTPKFDDTEELEQHLHSVHPRGPQPDDKRD